MPMLSRSAFAAAPPAVSDSAPVRGGRGEGGFTLVELAVSLLVMVEVILGALMIFDFNSKLANVQTQVTDMQQSLRAGMYDMVRTTRMAGRGGLTATTPSLPYPLGGAIEVRNNVGPSTNIAVGGSSPAVVAGTDILKVRGVFSSRLYQIDWSNPAAFILFDASGNPTGTATTATRGVMHVCSSSPAGVDIVQDLTPLAAAITAALPEALIVVSSLDDAAFAVVELNAANSLPTSTACATKGLTGVTLAFNVVGDAVATSYRNLSSVTATAPLTPNQNLPLLLTKAAWVGILEEYRYYVRSDNVIPGNAASEPLPRLSRARFYPGTEQAYAGLASNLSVDIADNILDLQVALGIDKNGDGVIDDQGNAADEWLYNAAADNPLDPAWLTVAGSAPVQQARMPYVRISLLARTARRDFSYTAPPVVQIEDHVYNLSPPQTDPINPNTIRNSMFRRRLLQTVVGPRNL